MGHLTDDGDAGEDKMEKMAAAKAQSIWDIAKHYTDAYWADVKALNLRAPAKWRSFGHGPAPSARRDRH